MGVRQGEGEGEGEGEGTGGEGRTQPGSMIGSQLGVGVGSALGVGVGSALGVGDGVGWGIGDGDGVRVGGVVGGAVGEGRAVAVAAGDVTELVGAGVPRGLTRTTGLSDGSAGRSLAVEILEPCVAGAPDVGDGEMEADGDPAAGVWVSIG